MAKIAIKASTSHFPTNVAPSPMNPPDKTVRLANERLQPRMPHLRSQYSPFAYFLGQIKDSKMRDFTEKTRLFVKALPEAVRLQHNVPCLRPAQTRPVREKYAGSRPFLHVLAAI